MIKIVFNFKCIYIYACVTCYFFFFIINNLTNIYLFIIKFVFNFNNLHVLHASTNKLLPRVRST